MTRSPLTGDPQRPAPARSSVPGRWRFPKSKRVRLRADFLRIQAHNVRVTTPHLVLLFALRRDETPSRMGLIASRKVGCAVERNRGKRLVREAFRLLGDDLRWGAPVDCVVILRAGVASLKLRNVVDELRAVVSLARKRIANLR